MPCSSLLRAGYKNKDMNKDSAISALRIIHRLIGNMPASHYYGMENPHIISALDELQKEALDEPRMQAKVSSIRLDLQMGILAVPPGELRRESVLQNCESLLRSIDPTIGPPDW
jgi:hypothetical protein